MVRQYIMAALWWSKTAHFMVAGKLREREKEAGVPISC
jgi:hypothetical protein